MQQMENHDNTADRPPARRQLFGRRVGRGLTPELTALLETRLPQVRPDLSAPPPAPLTALFPVPVEDVWLEVGFGGGEHLFAQAQAHPGVGFIGCEPFVTGVGRLLRQADAAGLANLLLHDDDARQLIGWLPDASIGRLFVLFPDPWPKKRHFRRRFLHESAFPGLARVLRPGAHLFFATDIASYADMVVNNMSRTGNFAPQPGRLPERPAHWPATRYEAKAIKAGRVCQFFIYERV